MSWVSVIIAAISLAREVVKYLSEIEKNKHEKARKVTRLKDGIKTARKTGDTKQIELAFAEFGIHFNSDKSVSDGKEPT